MVVFYNLILNVDHIIDLQKFLHFRIHYLDDIVPPTDYDERLRTQLAASSIVKARTVFDRESLIPSILFENIWKRIKATIN